MSKKKFKEKKSKKEKEQKDSVHKEVLRLLNDNPGRAYDFKQIARKIGAKNRVINSAIFTALEKLESDGKIKQLATGSFASVFEAEGLTGTVDHVNPRFAYFQKPMPSLSLISKSSTRIFSFTLKILMG